MITFLRGLFYLHGCNVCRDRTGVRSDDLHGCNGRKYAPAFSALPPSVAVVFRETLTGK